MSSRKGFVAADTNMSSASPTRAAHAAARVAMEEHEAAAWQAATRLGQATTRERRDFLEKAVRLHAAACAQEEEQLATLGAVLVYGLANCPVGTRDALLSHCAAALAFSLALRPVPRRARPALRRFLASLGVTGPLLRSVAAQPVALSSSTGQWLLDDDERRLWRRAAPGHPEPLNQVVADLLLDRVNDHDAHAQLFALAPLLSSDAVGLGLWLRLLALLNAAHRRRHLVPVLVPSALALAAEAFRLHGAPASVEAREEPSWALSAQWNALHAEAAAAAPDYAEAFDFHDDSTVQRLRAEFGPRLRAVAAERASLEAARCCALLLALVPLAPHCFLATGAATRLAVLVAQPGAWRGGAGPEAATALLALAAALFELLETLHLGQSVAMEVAAVAGCAFFGGPAFATRVSETRDLLRHVGVSEDTSPALGRLRSLSPSWADAAAALVAELKPSSRPSLLRDDFAAQDLRVRELLEATGAEASERRVLQAVLTLREASECHDASTARPKSPARPRRGHSLRTTAAST